MKQGVKLFYLCLLGAQEVSQWVFSNSYLVRLGRLRLGRRRFKFKGIMIRLIIVNHV